MKSESILSAPTRCGGRAWPAYLTVLALALVFYIASMAPGVLWQDSGLAQVRVLRRDLVGKLGLALSHPLYYVTAIAFQSLPFSESAYKTNLVSAVCAAVTVANVFLLLRLLTRRNEGAAIGAIILAVAHTFWQHAALAEVYTLSTALLTGEWLCLVRFVQTKRARWFIAMLLLNGLGVSNHMLAILSLPVYAVLTCWLCARRELCPGVVLGSVAAWAAGASLYGGLVVAEWGQGTAFGDVVRSALFGRSYADQVLRVVPCPGQLIRSVLYLGLSFPTPAVLLVIPGVAMLARGVPRTIGACFGVLLLIHLLWAVRYDVPDQYTFFIPSLVLCAIVFGLGADRFLTGRSCRWFWTLGCTAVLPAAVYIVLPSLARKASLDIGVSHSVPYRDNYGYFLRPWKTGYRGPERLAEALEETLPQGAVLIADGTTIRPFHYFRLARGWRPDVELVPRLPSSDVVGVEPWQDRLRARLVAGAGYAVTCRRESLPPSLVEGYKFEPDGLIYRLVPSVAPQPTSAEGQ